VSSTEDRQDELRALRERSHAQAASSWETPTDLPDEPLEQISYWLERERLTSGEVVQAVDAARDAGAKWWEIGTAMGRTSEAARAYYQYHRKNGDT
jgi:hypothetical protein